MPLIIYLRYSIHFDISIMGSSSSIHHQLASSSFRAVPRGWNRLHTNWLCRSRPAIVRIWCLSTDMADPIERDRLKSPSQRADSRDEWKLVEWIEIFLSPLFPRHFLWIHSIQRKSRAYYNLIEWLLSFFYVYRARWRLNCRATTS